MKYIGLLDKDGMVYAHGFGSEDMDFQAIIGRKPRPGERWESGNGKTKTEAFDNAQLSEPEEWSGKVNDMGEITFNERLRLTVDDYEENATDQAEMTSRLLEPHLKGLVEWYGYGKLAGLPARGVYFTTPGDEAIVEENGGDWGAIAWDIRLCQVDVITDDHVVVLTVTNPNFSTED